jgi:hypothetical protein
VNEKSNGHSFSGNPIRVGMRKVIGRLVWSKDLVFSSYIILYSVFSDVSNFYWKL